jgi:hypothetical protein
MKVDSKELSSILGNSVEYSHGFLDGVEMNRVHYMRFLGGFISEAMGKYIDAKARMNPSSLHHIYEPGQTGNEGARLFRMDVDAGKTTIRFSGRFVASSGMPNNGGEPFVNRAEIMENGIGIVISPRRSDVLAFNVDGEPVFSASSVYIAHPGGDGVAGSFGRVVEDFFENFLTGAVLKPVLRKLNNPKEFSEFFAQGAKGGRPVGVRAGRKYFSDLGMKIDG